jgi:hypothetical protein
LSVSGAIGSLLQAPIKSIALKNSVSLSIMMFS